MVANSAASGFAAHGDAFNAPLNGGTFTSMARTRMMLLAAGKPRRTLTRSATDNPSRGRKGADGKTGRLHSRLGTRKNPLGAAGAIPPLNAPAR